MMRNARDARVALTLLALALSPRMTLAQGTLSTQGLGFPPGQLSTPAILMGGSIGEADPFSPLNPASIGLLGQLQNAFDVDVNRGDGVGVDL